MWKIYRFLAKLLLVSLVIILMAPLTGHTASDTLDEIDLLSPVDTSNPRVTLMGFLKESQSAYQFLLEADQSAQRTVGFRHTPDVLAKGREAEIRMKRAMRYLDLSNIPEARRDRKGLEAAILLKDILDMVDLPSWSKVPDGTSKSALTSRWEAFPGIEIEDITDGPRAGEFLFTQQTVKRLEKTYYILKKAAHVVKKKDFYTLYTSTPGGLLPPKWGYWLPEWTATMVWQQTLWQWAMLVSAIAICVLVYRVANRLQQLDSAQASSVRKTWEGLLNPILVMVLLRWLNWIDEAINITGTLDDALGTSQEITFFVTLSWFCFMLMNAIGRTLISSAKFADQPLEAVMVRNGFRILGVIAVVTTLYTGCKRLGLDVAPMLAGIGAGSLALSFGIQPYVKNAIGGITLLVNRTMTIGEFCQIGDITGIVEDIGLTSTCIRNADRSLVTLPNASIVDREIINFSRRDKYLFETQVSVKRPKDDDAIDETRNSLTQLFANTPLLGNANIKLVSLTADTLTFAVTADILTTDQEKYEAVRQTYDRRLGEWVATIAEDSP